MQDRLNWTGEVTKFGGTRVNKDTFEPHIPIRTDSDAGMKAEANAYTDHTAEDEAPQIEEKVSEGSGQANVFTCRRATRSKPHKVGE